MTPLRHIALALPALLALSAAATPHTGIEASVVKIHASQRTPNPTQPWAPSRTVESTGTGVVIDGERILTCAHVAACTSEILVEGTDDSRRIPARVEFIARDIDLAVLKVDEPGFFENRPAVPLRTALPAARDAVTVYGFPQGGDSLSITEGVVSRVEFERFYYDSAGFRIQIDAAVNPGNSGGPAIIGDALVGIVFSHIREGENIGYLVAAEEVQLFLDDVADGTYDGKPRLRLDWMPTEYAALRDWLRMPADVTGALIAREHAVRTDFPLHKNDVIVAVGSYNVDDRAMVRLDSGTPVQLEAAIQRTHRDGVVALTIWRDGAQVQMDVPLESETYQLTPRDNGETQLPYIVYGPLVFSPVTSYFNMAAEASDRWRQMLQYMRSPILARLNGYQRFEGEQLVAIVCPPLRHATSRGMPAWFGQCVATVNGTEIRNFRHFLEVLRDVEGEFAVFEFQGEGVPDLVVRATDIERVTDEILRENGIRDQMSDDARAVWEAR